MCKIKFLKTRHRKELFRKETYEIKLNQSVIAHLTPLFLCNLSNYSNNLCLKIPLCVCVYLKTKLWRYCIPDPQNF